MTQTLPARPMPRPPAAPPAELSACVETLGPELAVTVFLALGGSEAALAGTSRGLTLRGRSQRAALVGEDPATALAAHPAMPATKVRIPPTNRRAARFPDSGSGLAGAFGGRNRPPHPRVCHHDLPLSEAWPTMTAAPEPDRAIAALTNCADALRELRDRLEGASTALQTPFDGQTKDRHRAAHRPGNPGRIDADPGLRAVIMERISAQTFNALVAGIAEAFPPARQVRQSSVHRWWQIHGRAAVNASR